MPAVAAQTKKRKKTSATKSARGAAGSRSRGAGGGADENDAGILERARPFVIAITCLLVLAYFMKTPARSTPSLQGTAPKSAPRAAPVKLQKPRSDAFEFYLGYASDLMEDRVRKGSSLDALVIGPARVEDYVFEYTIFSKVWKGGVADLVEKPGSGATAWGLLYEFPKKDIPNLDKQKGVANDDPKYHKIYLTVTDMDGYKYKAFTYIVVADKRTPSSASPAGVKQFLPSIQYRNCIVNGARGAGLPADYIKMLEAIPNNENPFRRKSVGKACD